MFIRPLLIIPFSHITVVGLMVWTYEMMRETQEPPGHTSRMLRCAQAEKGISINRRAITTMIGCTLNSHAMVCTR